MELKIQIYSFIYSFFFGIIFSVFLDFFNSSEAPVINFTVVCDKDIDNVLDEYGYYSYEEYCEQKLKGFSFLRKFISYKKEYEIYSDGILENSGNYISNKPHKYSFIYSNAIYLDFSFISVKRISEP